MKDPSQRPYTTEEMEECQDLGPEIVESAPDQVVGGLTGGTKI